MYDVEYLVTLAQTTGYPVRLLQAKEINLIELADLPIIFLGFRSIDSKNPTSQTSYNAFEQAGENLIQTFETQICCSQTELPVIWRKLYKALQGKNERPSEEQFSSLTYQKGGVIGIENTRIRWLDLWGVQFPSFNPFTF